MKKKAELTQKETQDLQAVLNRKNQALQEVNKFQSYANFSQIAISTLMQHYAEKYKLPKDKSLEVKDGVMYVVEEVKEDTK